MNDTNTNQTPAMPAENGPSAEMGQQLFFSNSLGLFHAAADVEHGCALKLECRPARRQHGGAFFLTLMPQKDKAGQNPDGTRRHATFSWDRRVCVKLGLSDVCALLYVLQGKAESVGKDGKGLYHESKDATTTIGLRAPSGDFSGYQIILSRKQKNGGEPSKQVFVLSAQEALCVRILFEQGIFPIVFGYPAPGHFGNGQRAEEEPTAAPGEIEEAMPF